MQARKPWEKTRLDSTQLLPVYDISGIYFYGSFALSVFVSHPHLSSLEWCSMAIANMKLNDDASAEDGENGEDGSREEKNDKKKLNDQEFPSLCVRRALFSFLLRNLIRFEMTQIIAFIHQNKAEAGGG